MALSLASASLGYAPVMLAAPTVQRASAPQMVDLSSEQGAQLCPQAQTLLRL